MGRVGGGGLELLALGRGSVPCLVAAQKRSVPAQEQDRQANATVGSYLVDVADGAKGSMS